MLVVGGHGYVGCRVTDLATQADDSVTVVSREGGTRWGHPSVAWSALPGLMGERDPAESVVWLLDGAKHAELERLREFLTWAPTGVHVVFVSTCTVYGDSRGGVCDEDLEVDPLTAHARLKAEGEWMLEGSGLTWCVQRLGALYGVDERGARADRVEDWVTQAATAGLVTVPDPEHWRGWVHRDQAARALWRAARGRVEGLFNVVSSNQTFGQAAELAADPFGASVVGSAAPDLCDYRVDAARARSVGLLDERPGEDLASTVTDFIRQRYPDVAAQRG